MGEFATYRGESIKIGTCENFYYLRADQRHLVSGYEYELAHDRFRFPFPDEDDIAPGQFEDHSRGVGIPGYTLPATLSGDEHRSIQFTNPAGYNLCIPCPEQFGDGPGSSGAIPVEIPGPRHGHPAGVTIEPTTLSVHRNGWNGGPVIRQQAFRGGVLVTLASCGACGALHRLDTLEDAEPVIEAFRAEAVREEWRRLSSDYDTERDRWSDGPVNYGFEAAHPEGSSARRFYLDIAARILAGYFVRPDGSHLITPEGVTT